MFFGSELMSKDVIKVREIERIGSLAELGSWSLYEKVAIACRALYADGQNKGLSGQVSARGATAGYITQALGTGFDEVSVSNLLLLNSDLDVLEGDGIPNPANRFHSWIYRSRPDVGCIIHVHSPAVSALSMTKEKLEISHMDTCCLYEEIAYLDEWPGIPIGNDEGEIICNALAGKKALIMAHHGYLVAAGGVPEGLYLALQIEHAAKIHLMARSVGDVRKVDRSLALEAKEWLLLRPRVDAFFRYQARKALRADETCLD